VIYLDSSVVLAQLLAEERHPKEDLWDQALVSSRLLEYEVWNRLHAYGAGVSHAEEVRDVLDRIAFLELTQPVLARALEPFPTRVRTLDALHLASVEFLRAQGQTVRLASYDARLLSAAKRLKIPAFEPR
jgi:predicted nucleic acid-binding protein